MKIFIVTHNLLIEKWHLMPWRTVIEVVNGLNAIGHEATLVSLGDSNHIITNKNIPDGTVELNKSKETLSRELDALIRVKRPDVILWPVTWREPRWRTKVVCAKDVKLIGWFPGGVYSISDSLYALKKIGLKKALPYLLEAFYPKKLQLKYMRCKGIRKLLTMTSATARLAVANGWNKDDIYVIPPAKDLVDIESGELDIAVKSWLKDSPFILFMGPPSAIRGVYELLDAFDIAAKKLDSIRLVCLFRSDASLDSDDISNKIDSMASRDKIFTVWESLNKQQLNAYISACRASVMPFILVPSEIPLAIIETTAFGRPVLSTQCGGTGEFVSDFGLASAVGDVEALADSMQRIFSDDSFYSTCCKSAREKYINHPLWKDVAFEWGVVAEKTLAGS